MIVTEHDKYVFIYVYVYTISYIVKYVNIARTLVRSTLRIFINTYTIINNKILTFTLLSHFACTPYVIFTYKTYE